MNGYPNHAAEIAALIDYERRKVAAMTPEQRAAYHTAIRVEQLANAAPYTPGPRQAMAYRPDPIVTAQAEAQDAVTHAGTDAPEFATGGGVIAAVAIGAVLGVALAVFLLGGDVMDLAWFCFGFLCAWPLRMAFGTYDVFVVDKNGFRWICKWRRFDD